MSTSTSSLHELDLLEEEVVRVRSLTSTTTEATALLRELAYAAMVGITADDLRRWREAYTHQHRADALDSQGSP